MEFVTIYALKGHSYNSAWVAPGQPYQAREKHAKLLVLAKRASRTPPTAEDISVAASQPEAVVFPNGLPVEPDTTTDTAPETASEAPPAPVNADEGKSAPEDDKAALRAEYARLYGKPAHGRMSEAGLRAEIEKAKA